MMYWHIALIRWLVRLFKPCFAASNGRMTATTRAMEVQIQNFTSTLTRHNSMERRHYNYRRLYIVLYSRTIFCWGDTNQKIHHASGRGYIWTKSSMLALTLNIGTVILMKYQENQNYPCQHHPRGPNLSLNSVEISLSLGVTCMGMGAFVFTPTFKIVMVLHFWCCPH